VIELALLLPTSRDSGVRIGLELDRKIAKSAKSELAFE
jgi:hypothetical protein